MELSLSNLSDTKKIAIQIAKAAKAGNIIALYGDLGSGKTSFTRYFIKYFLPKQNEILSPSFTLLQQYEVKNIKICHYDLYRIKDFNEIFELGLFDNIYDSITLIEWPEIIENNLPQENLLSLFLSFQDNIRKLTIKHIGSSWLKFI